VDGQIYAQPLYVPQLQIPNQGTRDVVFVTTQNNSVYAFQQRPGGQPRSGGTSSQVHRADHCEWKSFRSHRD
jgi:hypothetical protein